MAKVIFSIQYDVLPNKRDEYLNIMREMKNLVKAEGLVSYSVYEKKNKANSFEEIYVFANDEAYEQFDDNQNDRIDILMSKLSDVLKDNSQQYSTMQEILETPAV